MIQSHAKMGFTAKLHSPTQVWFIVNFLLIIYNYNNAANHLARSNDFPDPAAPQMRRGGSGPAAKIWAFSRS